MTQPTYWAALPTRWRPSERASSRWIDKGRPGVRRKSRFSLHFQAAWAHCSLALDRGNETMTIRPATPADAAAIFALLCEFAVSYRAERETFDRLLPGLLAGDHCHLPVAEVDGNV